MTADAAFLIDGDLFTHQDGRATSLDAHLALLTLVLIDFTSLLGQIEVGLIFFRKLLQNAGPLGDDDAGFFLG